MSQKNMSILIILLILSLSLRLNYISNRPVIVHDEAISYLAAAAHQKEYAEICSKKIFPYGEWANAEIWRSFVEPKGEIEFSKIKNDLLNYDVHPPIYFWLLHIWVLFVGVSIWSGPLLNILLNIINLMLIYNISKRILSNETEILIATVLYLFSPGVWSATFIARNYDLFTLFTLLLFYLTYIYINSNTMNRLIYCTISAMIIYLGTMTHYYFALIGFSAGFLPLTASFLTNDISKNEAIKKTLNYLYSVLIAAALFLITNIGFFKQISRFESQGQEFSLFYFVLRCLKTLLVIPGFIVNVNRTSIPSKSIVLLIIFFSFIIYRFTQYGKLKLSFINIKSSLGDLLYPFVFLSIASIFMVALYVSFFTHQAVMGPRYFAPLYPFFPFLLIGIFRVLGMKIYKLDLFFYVIFIIVSTIISTAPLKAIESDSVQLINNANKMIIDNTNRGILLKVLFNIPDNKKVYCAMQDDIVMRSNWINKLEINDLYFSNLMYENSVDNQNKILELLNTKHKVITPIGGEWGIWGNGVLFQIVNY